MSKIFSRIFHSEQAGLLLALLVLCLVISLLSPVFFTAINIKNVLRDASLIAIAGIGMVMIILLGEIDLSVGSTQAVGAVKRVCREAGLGKVKGGHGGTLDPLATGILPIAIGEATKTVAYAMLGTKGYHFTLKWGEARDTDDSLGKIMANSDSRPSRQDID